MTHISLHSITPELPIDIVYTWVNGSDPELLRGLAQLKNRLFEQEQREKEAAAKSVHHTAIIIVIKRGGVMVINVTL